MEGQADIYSRVKTPALSQVNMPCWRCGPHLWRLSLARSQASYHLSLVLGILLRESTARPCLRGREKCEAILKAKGRALSPHRGCLKILCLVGPMLVSCILACTCKQATYFITVIPETQNQSFALQYSSHPKF